MLGVVTSVNLALMGCCLGGTFIGTTMGFSSRDNWKSSQESFRTYIAETSTRMPFVMHLPHPFSLITSCPRMYQRHPKMLIPGPSDEHFTLLLQRVFDQIKATQIFLIKSLRVGQRGRALGFSYHELDWRLLVCPLHQNRTTFLFVSRLTAFGFEEMSQEREAGDRSSAPDVGSSLRSSEIQAVPALGLLWKISTPKEA